jgi:hypothetical protein
VVLLVVKKPVGKITCSRLPVFKEKKPRLHLLPNRGLECFSGSFPNNKFDFFNSNLPPFKLTALPGKKLGAAGFR